MESQRTFDPLTSLPRAQPARPADLDAVNLRVLSPFQRALLVIDGTVTNFIEAYTMEPVDVERIAQSTILLSEADAWLDAERGAAVLLREVLIEGRQSQTLYAYATSLILPDRLPATARSRLEVQGESLGRVLNDHRLETRREILWYGREQLTNLPPALAGRSRGAFVSRAYRIIAGQAPLALIHERFPAHPDRPPTRE